MAYLQTICPKLHSIKSWWNLSPVICILYFSVYILNTKHTVLSSAVCVTNGSSTNRTCHCINNNSIGVQCLRNITDLCSRCHAKKSYQLFCEVMSQFNCQIRYSVKWNCTDCLDAYTSWLLAVFNPNSSDSTCKIESPVALCKVVLARCPYFAPNNSYGDTPAFDCPHDDNDYKPSWSCPAPDDCG